jgi:hypothetical protein
VEGEEIENIISLDILASNEDIMFINQNNKVVVLNHLSKQMKLAKRSINEGGDKLTIHHLKPTSEDEKYLQIKSNVSGKLIFLQSQSHIDIYDLNYELLKSVPICKDKFRSFNSFVDSNKDYLMILEEDNIILSRIKGVESSKEIDFNNDQDRVQNTERGNPIVDYIYLSKKKYGASPNFIGSPTRHHLVVDIHEDQFVDLEEYIDNIEIKKLSIKEKFNWKKIQQISGNILFSILVSRVPVHLATIENFTLVPLHNGKNFSEDISKTFEESSNKQNIIGYLVSMIRFGHYEHLLKSWTGDIFVISIVGRQSSGKSYILNRLFGTRFNVAANRCTDGIWMSCSVFSSEGNKNKLVIVLDCEGLFSIRRNNQEEMKMCLALSSISDILLLNQDLSFNRNLIGIFESMQKVIGRLKGDNLFKGFLLTLIRDVSHSNTDEAEKEFSAFIKGVYSREDNFLSKLFQGKSGCMCIVNFEDLKFNNYLNALREEYIYGLDKKRWKTTSDFVQVFKIMLAQVMTDDDTDIEEYRLKIQMENMLKNLLKLFLGSYEEEVLYKEKFIFECDFEGEKIVFDINHKDLPIIIFEQESKMNAKDLENDTKMISVEEEKPVMEMNSCQALLNKFEEIIGLKTDKNHSKWYLILKEVLNKFLNQRKEICLKYFEEMKSKVNIGEHHLKIMDKLIEIFEGVERESLLCSRQCRTCDRECVLLQNHKINCNCMTDHKCAFICEISEDCIKNKNAW